jgi:hypothetical protein
VYRLGAALFGGRTAALAAALVCLYPSLLGFDNLLLTEVLFTCLLCVFCMLVLRALRTQSLWLVALAGVVLGLAALTRSVLWPFGVVLANFLLIAWRGRFSRRLAAAALALAFTSLTLAPWAIRNTLQEHTFVVVDSMGGRNFMLGNYEFTPLYRMWDAVSLQGDHNWYSVLESEHAPGELDMATQGQIDQAALRHGLAFVAGHAALTAERDVVKFFDLWGLERELVGAAGLGYFGPMSTAGVVLLTALIFGSYIGAVLLGIVGAVMAPPADRRSYAFLLILIGFVCLIHIATYGHSRYHLPLMPIVLLFAASAWVNRRAIWSRRGSRRWWLASAASTVLVSSWLLEVLVVDAARFWTNLALIG